MVPSEQVLVSLEHEPPQRTDDAAYAVLLYPCATVPHGVPVQLYGPRVVTVHVPDVVPPTVTVAVTPVL